MDRYIDESKFNSFYSLAVINRYRYNTILYMLMMKAVENKIRITFSFQKIEVYYFDNI